jgi:predicted kinase
MTRFQQYLSESINDKGIMKAIFMGGNPAAGKSTIAAKLSGTIQPRVVNSDTWTEFFKVPEDGWCLYKEKIKTLTDEQLFLYLNSLLPLWVDGTSTNAPNLIKRNGILSGIGYDTGMIWVNTELDVCIKRSKERAEKIGRHVNVDFIKKSWARAESLKSYYKGQFTFYKEINNNDGDLTEEVVLEAFRKTSGFFSGPLENPIGLERIQKLRDSGGKYLTDIEGFGPKLLKRFTD